MLALQPQRILEIGCGTGLLLFQLAPQTQEYWATDFSVAALQSIDRQLSDRSLPQVKLLNRLATDFTDIPPARFDAVILNSIVQYFPNADYLIEVLEGAIACVAPGGVVFLGDLRSLPLLTAFHAWAQFAQADASLTQIEFRQRVDRARFADPELAIDPGFFPPCAIDFPKLNGCKFASLAVEPKTK
ncbi:MAG: class I SAM-dependent methyltransferase [Leptolyngbyaceae cyanobacterium SM1_3_5]|nr:class I SAM-dependent methyltransferase [Leptolyngbyaceae cyanobacterium SM1_3_5]